MATHPGKHPIIVLALGALLCLGACGNAATPASNSASAQNETEATNETATTPQATINSQTIDLASVDNARQLGGYVGEGGRIVKDGVLLRTATLAKATDADIARLKDTYHLAEVIDFRMTREIDPAPDPQIDGVKNLNLRIIDEEALAQATQELIPEDKEKLASGDTLEKYQVYTKLGIIGDQMYVSFLSNDAGKQGYAAMFQELLALPEGESLLFHCTQGKDRTGCAAMLILSALGVDEDTIMADYLLTNEFNAELIAQERQQLIDSGIKDEDLDTVMIGMDQVYPQTMANGLDWLKQTYGSVTGYITQELGVTQDQIAQLQDKFLS